MPALAPWTLIATDAPVEQLLGVTVALSSRHDELGQRVTVLSVDRVKGASSLWTPASRVRVTHADLGEARSRRITVPGWLRLDDLLTERLGGGDVEKVLVVPGARWGNDRVFGQDETTAISHGAGSASLYSDEQILARLDVLPAQGRSGDDHSPDAARARVARVRETYGEMATDIIYRIEHSALFDTSVPLTRSFAVSLMRWDDEVDRLGAAALDRLSREVQVAFDTARDHAETVGLAHLPSTAQPDARRALKAAHLATRAATDGEREAALRQVTRLLESIALFYLPAPAEVPRMIAGAPRAVEG